MDHSHPALQITARTKLPALSAVAALDACFHARSRDLTHWKVSTATGGLTLTGTTPRPRPESTSTRQLRGDLEIAAGHVVPVGVDLMENRRRCVVAVRPLGPVGRSTGRASETGYVRAASEAAEALVLVLEDTVEQWVAAIDDHVEKASPRSGY